MGRNGSTVGHERRCRVRRLAVLVVTSLLLAGSGVAGAFGLPKTNSSTPTPPAHPVAQPGSALGAPKVIPGSKSKLHADANALNQARRHPDKNEPRHKRHPRPAPTSSPSSASSPTP